MFTGIWSSNSQTRYPENIFKFWFLKDPYPTYGTSDRNRCDELSDCTVQNEIQYRNPKNNKIKATWQKATNFMRDTKKYRTWLQLNFQTESCWSGIRIYNWSLGLKSDQRNLKKQHRYERYSR